MAATTALILYRGAGTGHVTGKRLLPRIGLLHPSGSGVVVNTNYSPWPQGGAEHGIHSSLGSRRRSAIAKALHEAAEKEEPPAKRQRKPKKAPQARTEETSVQPTESYLTPKATRRAVGKAPVDAHDTIAAPTPPEPEYTPQITRSISGIGSLRGRRRRAIKGALHGSAGGEGNAGRARRRPRIGRLKPYAVENPTIEQIIALLTAA